MRSEVSGLFSSWATVATRSSRSSSIRRARGHVLQHDRRADHGAVGSRAAARPAAARSARPAARAVAAPRRSRAAAYGPLPDSTWARMRSIASRTLGLGALASPCSQALAGAQREARLGRVVRAPRTRPSRSKISTGSGRLSIAACAAWRACSSSPTLLRCSSARRSAIALKSRASAASSSLPAHLRARGEVARPMRCGGLAQHRDRPQRALGEAQRGDCAQHQRAAAAVASVSCSMRPDRHARDHPRREAEREPRAAPAPAARARAGSRVPPPRPPAATT